MHSLPSGGDQLLTETATLQGGVCPSRERTAVVRLEHALASPLEPYNGRAVHREHGSKLAAGE
jgi:hypothetical protein